MYVLNNEGLNSPEWVIIKKQYENLTATIQNKYGDTRMTVSDKEAYLQL